MIKPFREDIDAVKRLTINLPDGSTTSLGSVAKVYRSCGPNTINREQARRRIVVQANTSGRGIVDVVVHIGDPIGQMDDLTFELVPDLSGGNNASKSSPSGRSSRIFSTFRNSIRSR